MGIAKQTTQDRTLDGRTITLNGHSLINFAQCSYLGLEQDERLKRGAIDAVEHYGPLFSSSRAYLSVTLFEEYEQLMEQLFGFPVIISPSTTMGHFANFPLLFQSTDAVILDRYVHTSVATAAQVSKARGVYLERIRHNDLQQLEDRIKKLREKYERVWYLVDGIYSMQGTAARLQELRTLQERYPQLHLYVDDAHGMSWRGKHGRGFALSQIDLNDRTVLITSLSKAFGTGGGCMVFPNHELRDTVRNGGSTLMFSGPVHPPTLGAGIASCRIHLSEEIVSLQAALLDRIKYFNQLCRQLELPLAERAMTPIRYIGVGTPEMGYDIVQRVLKRGYFINVAAFPSVPLKQTGLRITLTNHLDKDDIRNLLTVVSEEMEQVLSLNNYPKENIYAAFPMIDR